MDEKFVNFVNNRMLASESFQRSVEATWVSPLKTTAQWGTERLELKSDGDALVVLARRVITDRHEITDLLHDLHKNTNLALFMMRAYYREKPDILAKLDDLTATARNRTPILQEALELESQWGLLPEADRDLICPFTLAAFKTQRATVVSRVEGHTDLLRQERSARSNFNHKLAHRWQDCVAFYMAAVRMFPEGTPDGDTLRATIPTEDTAAASTADDADPGNPGIPGDDAPSGVTG